MSQDAILDQLEVYLAEIRYDKPESRVQADGTISRPQNAFILFRKVYNMMLSAKGTCPDQNNVSRGAASLWNALPQHRKLLYAHKAKEEREWYELVFPNYLERQRQRRALQPIAPKRHKTKKQPSPSRSSVTRSSMESDYVPTSSLRRADRPSRASKPEPMHVDEDAVKTEPVQMSPDIHHFDMDVDTPTVRFFNLQVVHSLIFLAQRLQSQTLYLSSHRRAVWFQSWREPRHSAYSRRAQLPIRRVSIHR